MKKNVWVFVFYVVFLFVSGCSGVKLGSRMPYAIDTSNQLNKTQPAPERDIPVAYHGADILRFVDDQSLLLGSVTFDAAGIPKYGPVILYDMNGGTEKWRVPRESHYTARYHFLAYNPNLIMRSESQGKIVHAAYDLATGSRKWSHHTDDKSLSAYRFSSAFTLTDMYVLSEGVLKDINMLTGGEKWQTTAPSIDVATSKAKLIALESLLVLVSGEIMAYSQEEGRLAWRLPNSLASESNVVTGSKGIYLYDRKVAVHVNEDGKMDWNWQSPDGDIILITPHVKATFVVIRYQNGEKDALHAIGARQQQWKTILPGNVMSPLLNNKGMIYLTTAPQETESGQRSLVGIDASSGKILTCLSLPSMDLVQETVFVPLPDKLILRENTLFVIREHYGISAIDLIKKKTAWTQPLFKDVKGENINLMSRVDPQFNIALKDQYNPSYVSSNLKSGQTAMNYQLKYQNLQQSTNTFTQTRPNLGSSAEATAASMNIQRNLNTAATAIIAMNAAADVSNAFSKALGEWLYQKTNLAARMTAITGIRIAEAQYQVALSNNYFVPPPTDTITVVDLNTGKRADLRATLTIPGVPGRAWTVALSPDETKLAAVGIGLNNSRYRLINRGMLEVPASSLVVYHPKTLNFVEQPNVPVTTTLNTTPTANVSANSIDPSYLIESGYPPLVAYKRFRGNAAYF